MTDLATEGPPPGVDASPWVVRFASYVPADGPVLDLACGGGRHSRFFLGRGHEVVAVDRDLSNIDDLMDSPRFRAIRVDLEDGRPLPLRGQHFSAVIVTNYLTVLSWAASNPLSGLAASSSTRPSPPTTSSLVARDAQSISSNLVNCSRLCAVSYASSRSKTSLSTVPDLKPCNVSQRSECRSRHPSGRRHELSATLRIGRLVRHYPSREEIVRFTL
jgi:Methyltransferase domain